MFQIRDGISRFLNRDGNFVPISFVISRFFRSLICLYTNLCLETGKCPSLISISISYFSYSDKFNDSKIIFSYHFIIPIFLNLILYDLELI